jgi:hypothetical protein
MRETNVFYGCRQLLVGYEIERHFIPGHKLHIDVNDLFIITLE